MKRLHRPDLFSWSTFSEKLNIDFNGFAWVRPRGNVLIDPPVMSPHDEKHLESLGGAAWIVLTNSAHLRGAPALAARFGARLAGPAAEKDTFPVPCDRWLAEGDAVVDGLEVFALEGSKTPGELALLLEQTTLICGDLVRSHRANSLMLLLPEQGLASAALAGKSVRRLASLDRVEAVLVGDGWSVFRDGRTYLQELVATLA